MVATSVGGQELRLLPKSRNHSEDRMSGVTDRDYDPERRREHEDRVIAAVQEVGRTTNEAIRGLREELRSNIRENKEDVQGKLNDLLAKIGDHETRMRSVEKEQTAMAARTAVLSGLVGILGAGLVEGVIAIFAKH